MSRVVEKIISGGQTGADRAGLEIAEALGIPTGGIAPKNYMTEDGPDLSLRDRFKLDEDESLVWASRTRKNVENSDGTVVFGELSGGSAATIRFCEEAGKPCLQNPTSEALRLWIIRHQIQVLNVAGNRASRNPEIKDIVARVLRGTLTAESAIAMIEFANIDDARAIAAVHIASWQAAYRGIVPDAYLDALSVDERERRWTDILRSGTSTTWVAKHGEVVTGFINVGNSRDSDALSTTGEVMALYVEPHHWRQGLGESLWNVAAAYFLERGLADVTLWVLESNAAARRFYESLRFLKDGDSRKTTERGGISLNEIRLRLQLLHHSMRGKTEVVRDATPDEIGPLVRLWNDAWHQAHAHLAPPALTRCRTPEFFRERLTSDVTVVRVVGPGGAPVGFHIVKGSLLDDIYVAAEVRGSGVAGLLLVDAEQRIREGGYEQAQLTCAVGNHRAARFYEKHGWERTATFVKQASTPEGPVPVETWRYEKRL